MSLVTPTPSIFHSTSNKKRKIDLSDIDSSDIRVPDLAYRLTKKAATIADTRTAVKTLDDASIFTVSARTLYQKLSKEMFGNNTSLRAKITSKSGKRECEIAGIPCENYVDCYLCGGTINCRIPWRAWDDDCKDCDHLLPIGIAVALVGIEATRKAYKKMVENGLNKTNFKI